VVRSASRREWAKASLRQRCYGELRARLAAFLRLAALAAGALTFVASRPGEGETGPRARVLVNARNPGSRRGYLARARKLVRDLDAAFGAAGRSAFRSGSRVDETAWEDWLAKKALRNVTPRPSPDLIERKALRTEGYMSGSLDLPGPK
jgi:hypothetical protein